MINHDKSWFMINQDSRSCIKHVNLNEVQLEGPAPGANRLQRGRGQLQRPRTLWSHEVPNNINYGNQTWQCKILIYRWCSLFFIVVIVHCFSLLFIVFHSLFFPLTLPFRWRFPISHCHVWLRKCFLMTMSHPACSSQQGLQWIRSVPKTCQESLGLKVQCFRITVLKA